MLSVVSGFWFQISFERQNYLIFKSSSIWLSFTFIGSFLPVFSYVFVLLSTQWCPIFSHQKIRLSWDSLPDRAFQSASGALLWRPHTSVSSKDDFLPQVPWEVVIKYRLCGKITGGHFSVTPYSGNPKVNLTTNSPSQRNADEGLFKERVISNEKLTSEFLMPSYEYFPDICSINLIYVSLNNQLKKSIEEPSCRKIYSRI